LGETNIADEKISKNPGREEIRKNIRPKRQLTFSKAQISKGSKAKIISKMHHR